MSLLSDFSGRPILAPMRVGALARTTIPDSLLTASRVEPSVFSCFCFSAFSSAPAASPPFPSLPPFLLRSRPPPPGQFSSQPAVWLYSQAEQERERILDYDLSVPNLMKYQQVSRTSLAGRGRRSFPDSIRPCEAAREARSSYSGEVRSCQR